MTLVNLEAHDVDANRKTDKPSLNQMSLQLNKHPKPYSNYYGPYIIVPTYIDINIHIVYIYIVTLIDP